jgi:hypothetical protein
MKKNSRRSEKKRSIRRKKKQIKEQGLEFKNQVFLDEPSSVILRKLKLEPYFNVRKMAVIAHGSLLDLNDNRRDFKIPHNIVLMYFGNIGQITIGNNVDALLETCNGSLVPQHVMVPGETVPNLLLSQEFNKYVVSGIFECSNNEGIKRIYNDYLLPTKETFDSYDETTISHYSIVNNLMYGLNPSNDKYKNNVLLSALVNGISSNLHSDEYAFIFVYACLGYCDEPLTLGQLEKYKTGYDTLRSGYTRYKIPKRVTTMQGIWKTPLGTEFKFNIRPKDEKHYQYIIKLKNFILSNDLEGFKNTVYENIDTYKDDNFREFLRFARLINSETKVDNLPLRNFIRGGDGTPHDGGGHEDFCVIL